MEKTYKTVTCSVLEGKVKKSLGNVSFPAVDETKSAEDQMVELVEIYGDAVIVKHALDSLAIYFQARRRREAKAGISKRPTTQALSEKYDLECHDEWEVEARKGAKNLGFWANQKYDSEPQSNTENKKDVTYDSYK